MSGALAATLQSACCCGRGGDGGGGSPDDCGPSGSGAESDRATTAVAVSLDLNYTEFFLENKIRAWRQDSVFSAPQGYTYKNCVIQNGTSCENEYPNGDIYIPYACGPLTFAGPPQFHQARGPNLGGAQIQFATCYNQTGDSNHLANFITPGTGCTCRRIGGCNTCSGSSIVSSGGSAVAEQVMPAARKWRTYQSAQSILPQHTIGQWDWLPRRYTVRTVAGLSYSHDIRLFCPSPWPLEHYGQVLPSTFVDPTGAYVDVNPDMRYQFVTGRWGNSDVGRLYGVVDALIEYVDSYTVAGTNLGPGWLGTVRVAHIYRDQHLAARHRFGLIGQERWTVSSGMPPEQGYLPLATAWVVTSILPWTMWKSCASDADTVFGTYVPIGAGIDDPAERQVASFDPCPIAGQRRIDATLRSMTVS